MKREQTSAVTVTKTQSSGITYSERKYIVRLDMVCKGIVTSHRWVGRENKMN